LEGAVLAAWPWGHDSVMYSHINGVIEFDTVSNQAAKLTV